MCTVCQKDMGRRLIKGHELCARHQAIWDEAMANGEARDARDARDAAIRADTKTS